MKFDWDGCSQILVLRFTTQRAVSYTCLGFSLSSSRPSLSFSASLSLSLSVRPLYRPSAARRLQSSLPSVLGPASSTLVLSHSSLVWHCRFLSVRAFIYVTHDLLDLESIYPLYSGVWRSFGTIWNTVQQGIESLWWVFMGSDDP